MKPIFESNAGVWLTHDRPIESSSEDWLGRKQFAEKLGVGLSQIDCTRGVVVSLEGRWGSGKTSIKHLLFEALENQSEGKFSKVDFAPWQLSGLQSLTVALFMDVWNAIEGQFSDEVEAGQEGVTLCQVRKTFWRYVGKIAPIEKIAPALALTLGSFGADEVDPEMVKHYLTHSVALGKLASLGAGIGSEQEGNETDDKPQSLAELKDELEGYLKSVKVPLIIVVDDIDRLLGFEIVEIFQLVKANLDFPNVIFLLLFERSVVEAALNKVAEKKGREYLEKIVQLSFFVPFPRQSQLDEKFDNGIKRILKSKKCENEFQRDRWNDSYTAIRPFIDSPRVVNRLLSSIDFQISNQLSEGIIEVDPIDLIILETLRVLEPQAHAVIAQNKILLTEGEMSEIQRELLRGEEEEVVDGIGNILEVVKKKRRKARVERLLADLFPSSVTLRAKKPYVKGVYSTTTQQALSQKRVQHEDCFDRYFALQLSDSDVAEWEYKKSLELISLPSELVKYLALCSQEKKRQLLQRIEWKLQGNPLGRRDGAVELAAKLIDFADKLMVIDRDDFSVRFNSSELINRIVFRVVQNEKTPRIRGDVLREIFDQSSGVHVTALLVGNERSKNREAFQKLFPKGLPKSILDRFNKRVEGAFKSGTILEVPGLSRILRIYQAIAGIKNAKGRVKELLKHNRGVYSYIKVVTNTAAMGDLSIDYVSKDGIFEYSNFDEINKALKRERARGIEERDDELKDMVRRAEKWDRDGVVPEGMKLLEQVEMAQYGR